MRREHAVQFPVAACKLLLARPRCRDGEILKDETAIVDIFFQRRERDRSTAFVQGQVFPPESSVDQGEHVDRRAVVRLRLHDLFLLGASRFKRRARSCLIFGHARQQAFIEAAAQNNQGGSAQHSLLLIATSARSAAAGSLFRQLALAIKDLLTQM